MVEIKLTRGALNLLTHLLSGPGWCTDLKLFYLVGRFLVEGVPEPEQPPESREEQEKFVDEEIALEIDPELIPAFRKCIEYHVSRGSLGINKHTINLTEVLGIGG